MPEETTVNVNTDNLFDFDDALDQEFQNLPDEPTSNEVPDGKYDVRVEKVSLDKPEDETKSPRLNWQLKVVKGKHKGRMLFKTNFISDKTVAFLKNDLLTAGLKLKSLKELKGRLPELLDTLLAVTKKAQKNAPEYYNVFINSKLDEIDEDDVPVSDGEDVPF